MEQGLLNNIKTLLKSSDLVYNAGDYTSATILYFKAAFAILDLIILKATGSTPKDHSERFRILQKSFPELYDFIDKYFKIYRDTYSITISKNICDEFKKNVRQIIEKYKIQV